MGVFVKHPLHCEIQIKEIFYGSGNSKAIDI